MTDPVDTDALRRDARVLSPGFPGVEKRLNAAADEVDRLRAQHIRAIEQFNKVCEQSDLKTAEIERLRTAIENAPHNLTKQHSWHGLDMTLCRCWKADVL